MFFNADLESEVTFRYNVLRRINNFDETHLTKSSEDDKGGPWTNSLTYLDLPRAWTRVCWDGWWWRACNKSIWVKPPRSKSMKPSPIWPRKWRYYKELPEVVGWFGFSNESVIDTQIAIRTMGSLDETLFIETFLLYKSLVPNLAPRFKCNGDQLIKGPIFIKTDSGPGQNCKSKAALKFCHNIHCKVIHLGPCCPNATLCNQKMDIGSTTWRGILM